MVKKRCFLAIRIPSINQYNNVITQLKKDLDVRLKPVDPDLYHLTLHFFGDISSQQIQLINESFKSINFDPFQIKLGGTNIIPPNAPHKVRVLFVNIIDGAYQLKNLVEKINKILSQAGFKVKRRQYLPHLTVARVKGGKNKKKLAKIWLEGQDFEELTVDVDRIELVHSVLTPQGPNYTTLSTYQ